MTNFYDHPITTQMLLVYTNAKYDLKKIYDGLKICKNNLTGFKNINPELLKDAKTGDIYQIKSIYGIKGLITNTKNFRNQITIRIFIIDKVVTVKVFRTGKFQFTGIKNDDHAFKTISTFYKLFLKIPDAMDFQEYFEAVFVPTMININFVVDFTIDRKKLDQCITKNEKFFYSNFEPTSNTSTKITFLKDFDLGYKYNRMKILGNRVSYTKSSFEIPTKKKKARHTFLVFNGTKIIQSGRYYDTQMKDIYEKFTTFLKEHKQEIEMKFEKPKTFDFSSLEGLKI